MQRGKKIAAILCFIYVLAYVASTWIYVKRTRELFGYAIPTVLGIWFGSTAVIVVVWGTFGLVGYMSLEDIISYAELPGELRATGLGSVKEQVLNVYKLFEIGEYEHASEVAGNLNSVSMLRLSTRVLTDLNSEYAFARGEVRAKSIIWGIGRLLLQFTFSFCATALGTRIIGSEQSVAKIIAEILNLVSLKVLALLSLLGYAGHTEYLQNFVSCRKKVDISEERMMLISTALANIECGVRGFSPQNLNFAKVIEAGQIKTKLVPSVLFINRRPRVVGGGEVRTYDSRERVSTIGYYWVR